MTTHQQLTGSTDDEFLRRMIDTTAGRFTDAFWALFDAEVRPRLPDAPAVVDLGCGPGLFLQAVSRRIPAAALTGYDLTPAMIDHARGLDFAGPPPRFDVADLTADRLPLADGSIHLGAMTAVLHVFDDPFAFLAKARRALAPGGIFLLYDWVRTPLREYLADRLPQNAPDGAAARRTAMRLFPSHNKYTIEDWRWLLGECGFNVVADAAPRPRFHAFVTTAR